MDPITQIEINIVLFLQSFGDWLKSPILLFSFLGQEEFFMALLPFLYWCVDARLGLQFAIMTVFSNLSVSVLKLVFCVEFFNFCNKREDIMYWTLELASKLEDAPWPATKEELIDFAIRSGAPMELIDNLKEIEDDEEVFESIEDLWPDYPTKDDFFFNEDEY